jgi:hypothetical protein
MVVTRPENRLALTVSMAVAAVRRIFGDAWVK